MPPRNRPAPPDAQLALLEKLELRHTEQGHLAEFDPVITGMGAFSVGSCCEELRIRVSVR